MIVFVRIDHPKGLCCAFLNTVTEEFVTNRYYGCHTFDDASEVARHPIGERLAALVPPGFWEGRSDYWDSTDDNIWNAAIEAAAQASERVDDRSGIDHGSPAAIRKLKRVR